MPTAREPSRQRPLRGREHLTRREARAGAHHFFLDSAKVTGASFVRIQKCQSAFKRTWAVVLVPSAQPHRSRFSVLDSSSFLLVKRILGRPTGLWEREPTRRRDVFAFHFENLTRRRLRVLNPVPCGRSCLVQDTLFHYLRVY